MCTKIKNFISSLTFLNGLAASLTIFMVVGFMPNKLQAGDIPPLIFLNDTPRPITVTRGQPVRVPMFVVGGDFTNRQVELFIWRVENENVFCLGPDGWTERNDWTECGAIGPIPALPQYIHFSWTALDSSAYLSNFDLHFCVDDLINGVPEAQDSGHIFCGNQKIVIKDAATESREPEPATQQQEESSSDNTNNNSQQDQEQQPQPQGQHTSSITNPSALSAPSWSFSFTRPENQPSVYERRSSVPADCTPSSASVSPTSISFSVYVGTESSKSTLYVKDNCRNYVDANATATSERITLSNAGTGRISVICDTSGLKVGRHDLGNIEVVDSFGEVYSIHVTVTVSEIQTVTDDSITLINEGYKNYSIEAKSVRYFKFIAGGKGVRSIQITATPVSGPRRVPILVKRGSKPTINDLNKKSGVNGVYSLDGWDGGANMIEIYDKTYADNHKKTLSKAYREDLSEPVTFYVMLYNEGDRKAQQRLSLGIWIE